MDISEYFSSPNPEYSIGLSILQSLKGSSPLVQILSQGESFFNRKKLLKEVFEIQKTLPKSNPVRRETLSRSTIDSLPAELHPVLNEKTSPKQILTQSSPSPTSSPSLIEI